MGYRIRKQLIIVLIILFVLGLIGFGVYWFYFRQAPTCADGIQNQNEEDIDCGGPCAVSCERLTIKDIQVGWVKYLRLEDNRYDLAAKINNPNPNFGLSQFSYVFKTYNSSGSEIKEQRGTGFILPDQEKYLIEGNVMVSEAISRVDLVVEKVPNENWQKINAEYRLPSIYVLNKEFKSLDDQPEVSQASGLIKNDSAFDFDSIAVSIILFDAEKQVIGVNKTEARTVLAGEERYFSALWFTLINGQVSSIDMRAETNLLSDENFISKYGAPEKFQEYQTK